MMVKLTNNALFAGDRAMAETRRWMKWILEEAETLDVVMPWQHGYRADALKDRFEIWEPEPMKAQA